MTDYMGNTVSVGDTISGIYTLGNTSSLKTYIVVEDRGNTIFCVTPDELHQYMSGVKTRWSMHEFRKNRKFVIINKSVKQ